MHPFGEGWKVEGWKDGKLKGWKVGKFKVGRLVNESLETIIRTELLIRNL